MAEEVPAEVAPVEEQVAEPAPAEEAAPVEEEADAPNAAIAEEEAAMEAVEESLEPPPEGISIDFSTKHPLQRIWTMWYDNPGEKH